MNTFGKTIGLTIFGESHGLSIGAVLDGLPSGEAIDWDAVRTEMARRAPGKNPMSTARAEKDAFEVQSGFFNGYTTGTPLCAIIRNSDQHSRDYDQLRHIMRPGHADYSGKVRYGGFNDYRGGGHFSGRLTAPLVFAGAVVPRSWPATALPSAPISCAWPASPISLSMPSGKQQKPCRL